jgi:hypothetical protein
MVIVVRCRGVTPLFMNRMSESTLEGIRTRTKPPKSATKAEGPKEEAARKVYEHDGQPVIPAENLMACLIAAGCFVRLDAKRQLSTAKATLLPGILSLLDFVLPLSDPTTGQTSEWEADVRQGRNPNGGEAVAICRPRFDTWGFTVRSEIDTTQIGENVIRSLWDMAGKRIGLGDFRPARKGIFGQFVVDAWDREKDRMAAE